MDKQIKSPDERTPAQKPKRPLVWRTLRALGWLLVALMVFYFGLGIWFFFSTPTLSVNYLEIINAAATQSPPEQRAWPIYREALLLMSDRDRDAREQLRTLLETHEGAKDWPAVRSWVQEHTDAINLILEGSRKPLLGVTYGNGGSSNDAALWPDLPPDQTTASDPLIGVLLRHIQELPILTQALADDVAVAREQNDSARFLRDVDAIIDLATQVRLENFLVSQLYGLRLRLVAIEQIDATLTRTPQLFTDSDLAHLAQKLAKPDIAAELVDFGAERILFCDIVQRMYTDNGHGDGQFTFAGIHLLSQVSGAGGKPQIPAGADAFYAVTGPGSMLLVASRRQMLDQYDRLIEIAQTNLRVPIRDADWNTYNRAVHELTGSKLMRARYILIGTIAPRFVNLQVAAERYLGARDGALIGIALEAYRRGQGEYPSTLSELSPFMSGAVPVDRMNGQPLKYRLIDGKPLVYSIGADRDDDGGRVPVDGGGKADPNAAAQWDPALLDHVADGDWVIFPRPRESDVQSN